MSQIVKSSSIIVSTKNADAPQGGAWLLEDSQLFHPSLIFLKNPSTHYFTQLNHQATIEVLLNHYRKAQPKAGHEYWATRVWTLIIWQPIYLSLYSVHMMEQSFNLATLQQRVEQASVYGYSIETSINNNDKFQNPATTFQLMTQGLKNLVDELYESINKLMPLNKANSYGLIADTIMHALLAFKNITPLFNDQTLILMAEQWCQALGLVNRKGLFLSELKLIDIHSQQSQLMIKRKSCCRHYLIDPDDLCSSCSRQCWQTRIKRQSNLSSI